MSPRTRALDDTIFGVDVHSGDVRGDAPSYALVVLGGGDRPDGESIERDVVTHRKLRRRIAAEEPALLATDNVYELATDADDLVRFLRELPDATRLVQVTGAEQPEPLSRVANRHDVPYGKDPMQEAEASARLAAANVGQVVSAFTNTTEVKVSRGRSTGGGGWSEDRYTRKIHGAVRRRAREVESALDGGGFDYEAEVTEKYGGYSQALFFVEAGPDELPVGRERSGDVRIEIERERRDGIEFEPLAKRRDHVLVGVDPGTTTAVAIADLQGEVLDVVSTRTADTADVIEWIVDRGRPVLVAADVEPMPETVEKLRRSFDAARWVPETDLPVDTKKHRAPDSSYDNDHERDAVAAVRSAYDDHADQFERIARKVPREVDRGAVTARVLAEEASVEAVLRDIEAGEGEGGDGDGGTGEHQPRELTDEERRIRDLEAQVDRLQDHVADLESAVEAKDDRIAELEDDLDAARSRERQEVRERRAVTRLERRNGALERDVEAAEERAEALEGKLDRLKALWKLDHADFADVDPEKRGLVPVKPVDEFTTAAIEAAHEDYGLAEDDVLFLRNAGGAGRSTAERLVGVEPRVVLLGQGNLSEVADAILFDAGIPVGPADDVAMQEVDELAVARESDVEDVIDDWADRAADRERERTAEMVDQLISEHRAGDNEA